MTTNITTTSIRAAMFLLLASTATPRALSNHSKPAGPQTTKAAPAKSAKPAASSKPAPAANKSSSAKSPTKVAPPSKSGTVSAKTSSAATASKGTTATKGTTSKPPSSTSASTSNTNTNKNTNTNSLNGKLGSKGSSTPGTGGTKPSPTTASNGKPNTNTAANSNTNININKNVNVNQNTNTPRGGSFGPRGSNVNTSFGRNGNFGRTDGGAMVHGRGPRIDEGHFKSNFGRAHSFHVPPQVVGGHSSFYFGGVGFSLGLPWPVGWLSTDPVYVDSVGGAYVLCNPLHPGVQVPMTVTDCSACNQDTTAGTNSSDGSADTASDGSQVPTLVPGQTCDQVVAILGTPKSIVKLGMRQMYLYGDMRVTFVGGRLSDVR